METVKEMACIDYLEHVMQCKLCMEAIQMFQAQRAGNYTSKKKAKASRENGKLGGRPKK